MAFEYYSDNEVNILMQIDKIFKADDYTALLKLFTFENFYKTLSGLYIAIKLDEKNNFLGKLWSEFYIKLDDNLKTEFLNQIPNEKLDNWSIIHLLQSFFKYVPEIDEDFLSGWLIKCVKYVENDLANHVFYDSVSEYILRYQNSTIKILENYLKMNDNACIINLVSLMLGELRQSDKNLTKDIDERLKNSSSIQDLKYYYLSMISFYSKAKLTVHKLKIILDDILTSQFIELQEVAAIFAFKMYLLKTDKDVLDFLTKWFLSISKHELSDNTKYWYTKFLNHFPIDLDEQADLACEMITNIQPINPEHFGSWQTLQYILVKLLNKKEFGNTLKRIIAQNGESFLEIFVKLDYFLSSFLKSNNKELFSELFFSRNQYERYFIHKLFCDEFNTDFDLDENFIMQIDDKTLEIVFKELNLIGYPGKSLGRFFAMLNKRLDKVSDDLLKTYIFSQIIYQCLNYQKGCYSKILKIPDKSSFLSEIVDCVENYNKNVEFHKDSPINSFAFAGSIEAAVKGAEKERCEIQKQSKSKSAFIGLCKSVSLIYGNKHAHITSCGLSSSEDFSQISASVEIPILTFTNPCFVKLREVNLMHDIDRLQWSLDNEK